jgi:NAD(P)-dependent dehydrogenase (short-subunit alcohol dehydrogenase family)
MGHYLIYGGTGGIGSAIAKQLVDADHTVHLAARDSDKLSRLGKELNAKITSGDVHDVAFFDTVTKEAASDSSLDGLVYAVGTINLKPMPKFRDEEILDDFTINALGALRAVRSALPALKQAEDTASVLLFSTVAFAQGFAAHTSISMAKGAVEGLVKALATELSPKVRVNAIAPSLTETELAKPMTSSEQMVKAIADMHALRRIGQPEDMAALAEVLLTSKGSYITGQIIGVDGGRSSLRTKG